MLKIDSLRKQAKQLVRWHRAGSYSVGGRIRSLPRYSNLSDVEALALKFPLSEAQEIIAREQGFENWAALKSGISAMPKQADPPVPSSPILKAALPVLFVSDVQASAAFYRDKLGFTVDFLHGQPPFYGSVSRGAARLHLRFVHELVVDSEIREREELLSAFVEVEDIKGLFAEYKAAKVAFAQRLSEQAWGASTFIVLDPDGNWICFAD